MEPLPERKQVMTSMTNRLGIVRSSLLWMYNNIDFEPCVNHRKEQAEEALTILDALLRNRCEYPVGENKP
jgi:hypothetical protein